MLAGMKAALSCCLVAALALAAASAGAAELLVFGETHDQPDQQRQVAEEVQRLAAAGRLAAVVMEMAERPHRSTGLARDASEAQVRDALAWRGWDWQPYAAVVMNAVRAGVPVLGGNLPRAELRTAMADASLEATLPPEVRERIEQAVREGHCDLLPDAQLPGMVRVQIARDRSMAATVSALAREAAPQQTILLLTGAQHASRDRGVPWHLAVSDPSLSVHVVIFGEAAAKLSADEQRTALHTPQPDHCAALRQRLGASAPR